MPHVQVARSRFLFGGRAATQAYLHHHYAQQEKALFFYFKVNGTQT
ncbi:hypothetical protein [Pseudoduganella sp. HUAS MS19]